MQEITANDILGLIRDVVRSPDSHVCKHYVALNLLSFLKSKGYDRDVYDLEKALVESDDDNAIEQLGILTWSMPTRQRLKSDAV